MPGRPVPTGTKSQFLPCMTSVNWQGDDRLQRKEVRPSSRDPWLSWPHCSARRKWTLLVHLPQLKYLLQDITGAPEASLSACPF